MAEDSEDLEFISLQKSIKNTSWSGKILRALRNTGRGTWTPERTRRSPAEPGRTRKWWRKGKRKRRRMGPAKPCGASEENRGLYIQGSPSLWGTQLGQKGSLVLCGKRSQPPAWRTEWDLYAGYWPLPCPHSLRGCPLMQTRTVCWNVGLGEQTQAEDCSCPWGDILSGQEGRRSSANGTLVEEAWATREAEWRCWVKPKGKNLLAASPPCACSCLSRH